MISLKENFKQAAKELDGYLRQEPTPQEEEQPLVIEQTEPIRLQLQKTPAAPVRQNLSALIAAGTVVRGNLQAEESIELYGEVYGDIKSECDIKICGILQGNAEGKNITLQTGARVQGDLRAQGCAQIEKDCIVIGNISAATLLLGGKVKGELSASQMLSLLENACVMGNVTAATFCAAKGAVLCGEMRMPKSDAEIPAMQDEDQQSLL